jgi:excisionase family DNA binding protein
MKPQPTEPVRRVALTLEEAAAALGVSLAHLRRHILPELRVVRSGSARLVPVRELEAWADRSAALALGSSLPATRAPARPRQRPAGMTHEEQAS